MDHDFSEYALVNFINNYTQGLLERTMRSDNSYGIQNLYKENSYDVPKQTSRSKIRVLELTTKTFLHTILDRSKVSFCKYSCIILFN